jgi:hypothetical protein
MERMAIIALPVKLSLLSKEAKCPFLYSNYIFCFRGEDFLKWLWLFPKENKKPRCSYLAAKYLSNGKMD